MKVPLMATAKSMSALILVVAEETAGLKFELYKIGTNSMELFANTPI